MLKTATIELIQEEICTEKPAVLLQAKTNGSFCNYNLLNVNTCKPNKLQCRQHSNTIIIMARGNLAIMARGNLAIYYNG